MELRHAIFVPLSILLHLLLVRVLEQRGRALRFRVLSVDTLPLNCRLLLIMLECHLLRVTVT
tara:strand:+ start:1729 stop:1914 length:186 start_codon:yes stop_codon:yes gene_type:complete